MENYISSAIESIYENEDDYIILGLTGRTGSGCSTVAKILQTETEGLHHSLFNGDDPTTNDERKQKIIFRYFEKTWVPFKIIQVRSIITLLLLQEGVERAMEFMQNLTPGNSEKITAVKEILDALFERDVLLKQGGKSNDVLDFYNIYLPEKSDILRDCLGETIIVPLYQKIGANIRLSGSPFNASVVKDMSFTLVKKIHEVIRSIIDANRAQGLKSLIVIDAIRNPLEAIFLQDRIANFHLVAISCPNEQRLARLVDQDFSSSEIAAIDETEYKNRDLDIESTYSIQDIQGCLQRADIYLSNPDGPSSVGKFINLTNQIIRVVSLIKRPGIVTPTPLERCMQIAYTAKLNSGCISRQVGALVTDKNFSVKAIGWNDTPKGQVPCNLRSRYDLLRGSDSDSYSNFEKNDPAYIHHFTKRSAKYVKILATGRNISYCFKSEFNSIDNKSNQVHTRSLHAEENAFLQISKYGGGGVEGGFLFTTASPCELCAKKAYQLGIAKIFYIDPYPGISISHILEGGVANPYMELFSGAIGRSFHKLYSPIMAYKDELNALADDVA